MDHLFRSTKNKERDDDGLTHLSNQTLIEKKATLPWNRRITHRTQLASFLIEAELQSRTHNQARNCMSPASPGMGYIQLKALFNHQNKGKIK